MYIIYDRLLLTRMSILQPYISYRTFERDEQWVLFKWLVTVKKIFFYNYLLYIYYFVSIGYHLGLDNNSLDVFNTPK